MLRALACLAMVATTSGCIVDADAALRGRARARGQRRQPHVDAAASFEPFAIDENNGITVSGHSLVLGYDSTPALNTSSTYANVTKMAAALPFCALREGLSSTACSITHPQDWESPNTAMGNQLRSILGASFGVAIDATAAAGASAITCIEKGGTCTDYNDTFGNSSGKIVFDARAAKGAGFRIIGVPMVHGLRDEELETSGSFYATHLLQYITDIRTDVVTVTGQTVLPKLYLMQMGNWTKSDQTPATPQEFGIVPPYLASLARDNPDKIVMCAAGHHLGDTSTNIYASPAVSTYHLTNAGSRLLGEYFGECIYAVGRLGIAWGMWPAASASGSAITLDYSGRIPCQQMGASLGSEQCLNSSTPLAFDTTNVALPSTSYNVTQYGFELYCNSPQPPYVTSVSLSGPTVTINTDRNVPTGCTLAYANYGVPTAVAGNGNTHTNDKGAPRGNLRDTNQRLGTGSGQKLYNWQAAFSGLSISGGVTPVSTIATAIDDRRWNYAFVSSSGVPSNPGGSWASTIGSKTVNFNAGTWTSAASTPSVSALIGSARVNQAIDPTDASAACWNTTGTGDTTWNVSADQTWWFRRIGKFARAPALWNYFRLRGDTGTTNHQIQVTVNSTGGISVGYNTQQTGGVNLTFSRAGAVGASAEWGLLDVVLFPRAATDGGSKGMVCYNGGCTTTAFTTNPTAFGPANIGLNGDHVCTSSTRPIDPLIMTGFAWGERARSQVVGPTYFETNIHDVDFAALCPSPPCTTP
jgi:hypothetical protein